MGLNRVVLLCFLIYTPLLLISQTVDWSQKANPLNNSINGVAFSTDGRKILSGTNCHPASIRVFDVDSQNLEWDYTVGSDFLCIMGVTFSSNGEYIAAIEEFGNIFIFDNAGQQPLIVDTIDTGTDYGFSTAISPANDKVAVGCSNGKLKVYNLPTGTLSLNINAHTNWVTSVTYSKDGKYIITGGSDTKVKIWDTTGKLLYTCSGHSNHITNVKVSPDNNFVISSSRDSKIKIWDINTGKIVRTITGHSEVVNGIDISPEGSKIVSGASDNTCKIWDFASGDLITTFGVADSGEVLTVAWSPNGDKIATGNVKSDLVMWSLPETLNTEENNPGAEVLISLSPNPTSEYISIDLFDQRKITQVIIMDQHGKEYIRSDFSSILSIKALPPNVYFLHLFTSEGYSVTKKFIKI